MNSIILAGAHDIGELPIAAAKALQFQNTSSRNGGVSNGVHFEFWPGQAATVNGELYVLQTGRWDNDFVTLNLTNEADVSRKSIRRQSSILRSQFITAPRRVP